MGKKKKRNFNSNSLVHNNSAFISPSDQLKNIELRNTTNELKGKLHLLINLVTVLKENNFSYDISIQPYKHGKPPSEIKKHEDGSHYSDQRLNDIVHKMHTTYNSIDVNKLSDRDVVSTRNFNPVTVRMTPANLTEVEQAFVITKINEIAGSYSKIEGWIEILECCNRIRETDMALKLRGLKRMLEVQIDGLKQKPKIFFLNPETVLSLLQNLMKFYQYANNLKKLYDHSITLLEMQHKNKRLEKDNSSTSKMMSITGAVNGNEATGYNGGEDEKTCKVVNGNESTGNKGREGEKNFKAISCSEGAGREESEDGKSFKAVSVFGKDTVIGESISGSTPQTFLQQKTASGVTLKITPADLNDDEKFFVVQKLKDLAPLYKKMDIYIEILSKFRNDTDFEVLRKFKGMKRMVEVGLEGLEKGGIFYLTPHTITHLKENIQRVFKYIDFQVMKRNKDRQEIKKAKHKQAAPPSLSSSSPLLPSQTEPINAEEEQCLQQEDIPISTPVNRSSDLESYFIPELNFKLVPLILNAKDQELVNSKISELKRSFESVKLEMCVEFLETHIRKTGKVEGNEADLLKKIIGMKKLWTLGIKGFNKESKIYYFNPNMADSLMEFLVLAFKHIGEMKNAGKL